MDESIRKARLLFEKSGKTLEELGVAMGYGTDMARKSAWQFLNKTADPRISMLRRCARALGVTLEDLVKQKTKS
jgi:transcriptional regulator with XRE-family HTH domain